MTAFKRCEVDRCPIGKGEKVGDELWGIGNDGDCSGYHVRYM